MGNTSSSSTGHKPLVNQKEPLTFHRVHSEHIRLDAEDRIAKRVESFCKGICFSGRPVAVGELVSIRCSDISTNWSGFLRIGFTSHNPSSLSPEVLPRYACPDMTNRIGNWAKALPERYGVVNYVITYSVNRQGEVYIFLNGDAIPGPFFTGVNVSLSLWALIDIYGNATGVEFIGKSLSAPAMITPAVSDTAVIRRRKTVPSGLATPTSIPATTPSTHHARAIFAPLNFHNTTGKNVTLNSEKNVAQRHVAEYANAYVFCSQPLNLQEKVVIQIQGTDASYTGGLTVGMTACDPSSLTKQDLPDDSDHLLDRLEYWVVHKDVTTTAGVGDELSFTLSNDGEVQFSKNAGSPVGIMHVDKTIPMWLFWDLYGQFSQIKLFGTVIGMAPATAGSGVAAGAASSTASGSSKQKSRGLPAPLQPLTVRPPQARSLSLAETSQTSPSLTVELPPLQKLTIGAPPKPPIPPIPPRPPRLQRTTSSGPGGAAALQNADVSIASLDSSTSEADENSDNMANECTVCFDRPCDSVLYTCGHICMCHECALNVKSSADPLCPICRQHIKDVIRIYKS